MKFVLAAVSLASVLSSGAAAQERCVATQFDLPAGIAEEMRPYLLCGLFQGDHPVRLNGQTVNMTGGGMNACGEVRTTAFQASEAKLVTSIPDAGARRSYVSTEFEKADRFLSEIVRSEELTVGEKPTSPTCGKPNAAN